MIFPPVATPAVKTAVSSTTLNIPTTTITSVLPAAVTVAPAKKEEKKAPDPKKEAEEAEKKRKAQWEAQQGIIDARMVDKARNADVFATGPLVNGILTNPLLSDITFGAGVFGGENKKFFTAAAGSARVESRRRIANSLQRQIDRYVDAHPEPTETDITTVRGFRAKREENVALGASSRTGVFSAFVPSSPLANGLTAVSSTHTDEGYKYGAIAARHALELARAKFLKNTSDVTARQSFNQARDFKEAKDVERKGTQAEKLNSVMFLAGSGKSDLLTQYGILNQQKGYMTEKNIAGRQLNLAEDKMRDSPSEDNWWKLRLARATFDWREQYEIQYRSRGLAALSTNSLFKNVFSMSQVLRNQDLVEAQKRISRITLQMRKRDYAKKYEGADETEMRFLGLSQYGKQSSPGSEYGGKPYSAPVGAK
jgi:hypothetical protein